jgi:lauroyl/myristoyl acyltransferase
VSSRVSANLFRLGTAVARATPGPVRYGAAGAVGRAGYALNPRLRRQARENYAAILGLPVTDPEVSRVAREAVVGYSKLMADFLLLPRLGPEAIKRMVDVVGLVNVNAALSGRRGAIAVTPHFGNWDIAAAAALAHGVPVTAVTEQIGGEELNREVVRTRERMGMKVIPLTVSAGKSVLNALRRNEVVALVCDLPKEGRNILVQLCGQPAMVPAGPALLSLRSGAPLLPISCRRLPDNRYRLTIQEPLRFKPSGIEAVDLPALAQAALDAFESTLRRHLEQWYLFSPMWGLVDETGLQPIPAELVPSPAGAALEPRR